MGDEKKHWRGKKKTDLVSSLYSASSVAQKKLAKQCQETLTPGHIVILNLRVSHRHEEINVDAIKSRHFQKSRLS